MENSIPLLYIETSVEKKVQEKVANHGNVEKVTK